MEAESHWELAESNKDFYRKKQGGLVVLIHLPAKQPTSITPRLERGFLLRWLVSSWLKSSITQTSVFPIERDQKPI